MTGRSSQRGRCFNAFEHRAGGLVPLLTDPLAHGAASSDALSVVVLSLPGFGFSGPPPTGGLTHRQVAEVVRQHLSILVAGQ